MHPLPRKNRHSQRGVALLMALFALLILSAIGLGMMYSANTETAVNSNYGGSMRAYYGAVGGLEEARDRIRSSTTNGITPPARTPTTTVGTIYIVNPFVDGAGNTVSPQPWNSADTYRDEEYCHEFSGTNPGAGTACSAAPFSGTAWYGYYSGGGSTYVGTTWSGARNVASASPNTNTPSAMDFRWVRIQMKTNYSTSPICVNASGVTCATTTQQGTAVCWNGTNEILAPASATDCSALTGTAKPVYLLTSLGVAPNGSRRMVQMEVADNPPFFTNAAVDTDDFVTVSGSSVTVNGYDNCRCSCTTAVGGAAPTCTDRVTHTACTGNTYAIYSSQTVTTSGNPALIAGTSPPVAQNQPFPYNVPALINKYSTQPGAINVTQSPYNLSCATATPYKNCGTFNPQNGTLGTLPNPWPPVDPNNPIGAVNQITYVPGSVDIQAHVTGAGVLVIDGDMTIHGGLEFYGLIIVRGVLTFSGSGTGQNYNVIGGIIAGNGSVADSLSGGINIQYDKCALLNNQVQQALQILTTRELPY